MISNNLLSESKAQQLPVSRRWIIVQQKLSWVFALSVYSLLVASVNQCFAVTPPTITSNSEGFDCPKIITITAPAGTIKYSIDGTTPSTMYTAPFAIFGTKDVKALADVSGTSSAVAKKTYNSDPDISTTPILWFKADNGLTVDDHQNPARVTSWTDLSAHNNTATSSSAAAPTRANSLGENAFTTVNFDGTQSLSIPSAGFANFTSGGAFFVVINPAVLQANARILDFGTGSNGNNNIALSMSTGTQPYAEFDVYFGTTKASVLSTAKLQTNQFQLIEATLSSSSQGTIYLNGVVGASTTMTSQNTPRTSNFLGKGSDGSNPLTGAAIPELIVINQAITDSIRTKLEAYLMTKYQIPSQLPAPPVFSLNGGTLQQSADLTITTEVGSITTFTSDGSDPTINSSVYSGVPVRINYSQTIKAASFKSGIRSAITSASYTLNSADFPAPTPGTPTTTIVLPTASSP